MTVIKEFKNLIAFHPGTYISEIIDDMEITQDEFAKRLHTSPKNISKLVNGEQNLTKEMATKLSNMLGTGVEVWLNLQKQYELKVSEIEYAIQEEKEISILNMINYNYFVENFGLSKHNRNPKSKLKELMRFLRVSSLEVLKKQDFLVSFRNTSGEFNLKRVINSNIMLELAIAKAKKIDSPKYNREKLVSYVEKIRDMTVHNPENFYPQLVNGLNECGVVLIALPHLSNSGINGAVKKIDNNRVMLMLNDKNKKADIFWFSLFHELGHIINEDFTISLDYELKGEFESRADEFARNILIPEDKYKEFCSKDVITEGNILEFAKNINIDPCIVLGRLQNDKIINYNQYSGLIKYCKININ